MIQDPIAAEPNVPDKGMDTWVSQVVQFPKQGPPGYTFDRIDVEGFTIERLTWRNRQGRLRGILYHYPELIHQPGPFGPIELQKPGTANLFVDPGWQRRGIGTNLLALALWLWPDFDFGVQDFTRAGLALAEKITDGAVFRAGTG